tara:strand:- start:846 stop:1175 length:330 start_codon:yes stop_codon:yes gene_type:complete
MNNIKFEPNRGVYLVTRNTYVPDGDLEFDEDMQLPLDMWQTIMAAHPEATYQPGDEVYIDLSQFLEKVRDPENSQGFIEHLTTDIIEIEGEKYIVLEDSRRFIKGKRLA